MNKWSRLREQVDPDSPFPQEVSPATARELLADMDAMYEALRAVAKTYENFVAAHPGVGRSDCVGPVYAALARVEK